MRLIQLLAVFIVPPGSLLIRRQSQWLAVHPQSISSFYPPVHVPTQAVEEALKYTQAKVAAKGDNKSIPAPSTWKLTPGAK